MPDFSAKSPGDPSPAKNAAWITAVSAAAAAYHGEAALGSSKGSKPAHQIDRAAAKVKNLTGSDLVRGNYVQLGEFELDARDPRKMWFEGNLYDEALPNQVAIVTNAVKQDSRVDAVLIGMAVAVVNVSDTEHRFAEPVDGEFVLASAATGTIEILDTITTTGEQECAVLLSASGGSGASIAGSVGMVFGDIPASHSWASMGGGGPSLSWTVGMGQVGPPIYDDGTEWNELVGVLLFDWARLASTKEEYIADDGTLALYDGAFNEMTPVVELVNGNRRWAWRRCVNRSKTDIRASAAEPILVAGYEQVIQQMSTYRLFIITDVMDHRAFPGFVAGEKQFPINQTVDGDFAMIEGYVAGNDQSVGRDANGDAEWQDDGACA